jgi:thymidylate synthase
MINELDRQYKELLETIINFGVHKTDRTGTGTKSVFGYTIRHNMQKGFPILTTKKVAWKQVTSELLWFLTGQTNIAFLHKHNNHIWDGDYKKSGRTDGELGPIYGKQWRRWEREIVDYSGMKYEREPIDQIDELVRNLKENPDSRRLMVSAWNVGELDQMVLPPCHYGFQCWTRELTFNERVEIGTKTGLWKLGQTITPLHCDSLRIPTRAISLMWNQRSVDTFLGLPFNISSYGLLLHILANECGMIPDELIGNLGDTHLYLNHIEQAKEQMGRTPYELPTLKTDVKIDGICCASPDDFVLEGYQYHPTIKAPLSN